MFSILDKFFFKKNEGEVIKEIQLKKNEFAMQKTKGEVLIDIPDTANELAEQLAFAKYFYETNGLSPVIYYPSIHVLSSMSMLSILKYILSPFSRGQRISRYYGLQSGLDHRVLNFKERNYAIKQADFFWTTINSKESLINFKKDEVNIGIAVYDNYLRLYSKETVDMTDVRLYEVFKQAILIYYTIEKFLNKHNDIKAVVLGHAVYVNWKILSDYAISKGIDVYVSYNSRFPPLHYLNKNRGLQTIDHSNLYTDYLSLEKGEQKDGYKKGEEFFRNRLSGAIDDGIIYMADSAYGTKKDNEDLPLDSSKKTIYIMLHSFFDSPHIYKDMVFPDFYEWCRQTFEFMQATHMYEEYNIVVKPHPNRIEGEDDIIEGLVRQYPFIISLNGSESNNKIIDSEPSAILTVYGTVAAEFSFVGIPVITCGDNPGSSFNFSFQARNKEEYFDLLTNIDNLSVTDEMKKEVCIFAYMYFLHQPKVSFSEYPFKRFSRRIHSGAFVKRIHGFSYNKFKKMVDDALLESKK